MTWSGTLWVYFFISKSLLHLELGGPTCVSQWAAGCPNTILLPLCEYANYIFCHELNFPLALTLAFDGSPRLPPAALRSLQVNESEPSVMWLSGLHIPESYLTALVQATCRKNGWPLDHCTLFTQVTKFQDADEVNERAGQGMVSSLGIKPFI